MVEPVIPNSIPAEFEVVELTPEDSAICRGCLADTGVMKNMYDWGLSEEFFKITDIKAIRMENITEYLCEKCEETLLACNKFKLQCQQSNTTIMNWNTVPVHETDASQNTIRNVLTEDKLTVVIQAPDRLAKVYLTCPLGCQLKYIKKRELLGHLVKEHNYNQDFNIELQYCCSHFGCPYHVNGSKCFAERKNLNQHATKVHCDKVFECKHCKEAYATETDCNRHQRSCKKTYECTVCDKKYRTKDRYTVHLMRKHPKEHLEYKMNNKAEKRKSALVARIKKTKRYVDDYICDSPTRTFATQTLTDNIRNDVTLSPWSGSANGGLETKTDEISTQTVFEDLMSLRSQASEDESLFSSVSLADIQTQTLSVEFGLSTSNKETITSGTQSPDLSIKETQTCHCLYETSSYEGSQDFYPCDGCNVEPQAREESDVLLTFNTTETQTSFDDEDSVEYIM